MIKILHYSPGLPHLNTGGSTEQSKNIMISQVTNGNDVSLLYPGHSSIDGELKIKNNKSFMDIKVYEIENPICVTILSETHSSKVSYKQMALNIYTNFLKEIDVKIIHIHTLVNLDEELISAASKLDIKIIFTSHDYLGICPYVNSSGLGVKTCTDYGNGEKCVICNR